MIQRHLTTNDADADTPSDQSLALEGDDSEDICKGAGHPCSPSVLDEYNDTDGQGLRWMVYTSMSRLVHRHRIWD